MSLQSSFLLLLPLPLALVDPVLTVLAVYCYTTIQRRAVIHTQMESSHSATKAALAV